jgi:hypothetical protein
VVKHRASDTASARRGRGVHGLDLGVLRVQPLDRADAEQFAVSPEAEERDRRVQQPGRVQRERVLRRRGSKHRRQVPLEQRPHVGRARIVSGDLTVKCHGGRVQDLGSAQVTLWLRPRPPPIRSPGGTEAPA